ncbi:MAG: thiosulfate sulfurtransferase GlpE [Alcanivorax sp.]|nr:thiosulfate sulfurtransferase GlpE [Alcanivorax sp.]
MATRISPEQGKALFDDNQALFVDIRDPASFAAGHLQGAVHLTQASVEQFLSATASGQPLVVYCYHGNSSQGAADWLGEQGYTDVVSLDGGYEVFRQQFPQCLAETED